MSLENGYYGLFGSKKDVASSYQVGDGVLDNFDILFAYYNYEDYNGYSWIVGIRSGKLYEVNGSHCSCYGLEGQWYEEETTSDSVNHRFKLWKKKSNNTILENDSGGIMKMYISEMLIVLREQGL